MPAKKKSSKKVASSTPRSAALRETMVVRSKMKEWFAAKQMRTSADVADAATTLLIHHFEKAVQRARAAGRSTIKASDL